MPATTATFPTGSAVPLPRKKPTGGAPAKAAKSFFERAVNLKRFLKTTPLKKVFDLYEKVEDPKGELKKAIKIYVQERVLFSILGPAFRQHPITSLMQLTVNAPKTLFEWGYNGIWRGEGGVLGIIPGYKSLGNEKHIQPKFGEETWAKINDLVKKGEPIANLPYEHGKLLRVGPKGSPLSERPIWIPRVGFKGSVGRAAELIFTHGRWAIFNPALPLVSLALSSETWAFLGWEDGTTFFTDKNKQSLRDAQGNILNKIHVTTEDGKEWTLRARKVSLVSQRKARVFTGRGARALNAVSDFSRYAYSLRSFFSRDTRALSAFGWESVYLRRQLPINLRGSSRFAQMNRTLFYLHPSNWLLGGETWKRLGWDAVHQAPAFIPGGVGGKLVQLRSRTSTNPALNLLHRVARGVYNFHPATLYGRLRNFLRTETRLLRILGPSGYIRMKGVDLNNWVSLSKNPVARGLLRLRQSRLGRALGGLRDGLGKAGGAVKGWLLAAKKKSDELWKKLIAIPLKFLFDLAVKALSKVAGWVWGKVGPLLSRAGSFISNLIPQSVKSVFAKIGTGIGESLVGKLFAKIGAELAGKVAIWAGLKFVGNILLKLGFEAFAWLTAPEIQILSYAWKGVQFLFGQTIGRLLGALSSRVAVSLATRLGVPLAQMGLRFLLGTVLRGIGTWLAASAWPAVAGFFTSTLPALVAGAMQAIGVALAGFSAAGFLVMVGIATFLAGLLFIITIYVPAIFYKPVGSGVTHTQVVLDKVAKVAPGDPAANFIGRNRLPVDNLEHTVEYFFRVRNTADKKATAVQVTDVRLNKTFPLDGSTLELNPGQQQEIGRFAVKILANSERVETNEAFGTAVIEGETITFSDVGLLLIGNPVGAPPCGWPATGTLRVLFLDKYPLCPAESECSGIQIVGLPDTSSMRPSQKVRSTLNGVVSQLWFDRSLGGVMKIKGLDGYVEIVYAYLTEASVKPVSGSLTKYGLEVGSRVNPNQEVAETYFGPLPSSWDTSLHYQVKISGVNGFDSKDPLEYTPTRPDRNDTVQAGGC